MNHVRRPMVSLVRLETYQPEAVDAALTRLLAPLGGIGTFVKPGRNVVLKPNLLKPAAVKRAVTTHPEVIRAVARQAHAAGANQVTVSDSSGIGTAVRCAKKIGLDDPAEPFDVADADDGVDHEAPKMDYHHLKLSRRMLEADALINLPKVKTHGQMGLSLAVKNTFGAVVGLEKAQWHFRAGRNAENFARLILEIHAILHPCLNIVDGVVGMEGNGPGSGDPRPLGLLAASTHAHALDAVLCRILEIPTQDVVTLRVAERLGLVPAMSDLELVGDPPAAFKLKRPWKPARPLTPNFVGSGALAPLMDRIISVRPHIDPKTCVLCGLCVETCAAGAMRRNANAISDRIVIDTEACISCFCCQEMCPTGAITVKAGVIARLLGLGVR